MKFFKKINTLLLFTAVAALLVVGYAIELIQIYYPKIIQVISLSRFMNLKKDKLSTELSLFQ